MNTELNFLPASEAAKKLGISHKGLGPLLRQGKLPAYKIANRWLIDKATLEEFSQTYIGKKGRPKATAPLFQEIWIKDKRVVAVKPQPIFELF